MASKAAAYPSGAPYSAKFYGLTKHQAIFMSSIYSLFSITISEWWMMNEPRLQTLKNGEFD